jgi:hypothetical protein
MTGTPTHMQFTVTVAEHETADPAWRLRHAADTFALAAAYFESDDGQPVRDAEGAFKVHALSWDTLGALRDMFAHEGLTVVREDEVPGNGIIVERRV